MFEVVLVVLTTGVTGVVGTVESAGGQANLVFGQTVLLQAIAKAIEKALHDEVT